MNNVSILGIYGIFVPYMPIFCWKINRLGYIQKNLIKIPEFFMYFSINGYMQKKIIGIPCKTYKVWVF